MLSNRRGQKLLSRHIDVLIWDSTNYPPLFRNGYFVVITPDACHVAVEVKGHLTHAELNDAIDNLDSLSVFYEDLKLQRRAIHTYLFAFTADKKLKFPGTYFNALHGHYTRSDISLDVRVGQSSDEHRWHTSWINGMAIVDAGGIAITRANWDKPPLAYMAYETKATKLDDTYGFLERAILRALLNLNHPFPSNMEALRNTVLRNSTNLSPDKCIWLLPQSKVSLDFFADKVPGHTDRLYSARKPRESATTKSAKRTSGKKQKHKRSAKGKKSRKRKRRN